MSWPTVRLKYITRLQSGLTIDSSRALPEDSVTLPYLRVANVQAGWLDLRSVTEVTVPRDVAASSTLCPGDVLMTEGGDLDKLGRGTLWSGEIPGCLHQNHVFALRVDSAKLEPRFLAYVTQSSISRHYFESTGSRTTNLASTNSSKILNLPILLPPLVEQRRISNFLDREISKIASLVSAKSRLLALLDEKIDGKILECVGESPISGGSGASTPAIPMRRVLSKTFRPAVPGSDVVTAFRDGQVTARSARRPDGYTLASSEAALGQYVEVGDVVIHGLDGFAGAIGTSEAAGNCSPVYHVCTPHGNGNALFLGRLLRVLAISGYLGAFATSTRERAVDFRNWELFGRIPIPDVPVPVQDEVGAWISAARPLRVLMDRSFALAEERRQALITAAVTGQIDVTTARGVG